MPKYLHYILLICCFCACSHPHKGTEKPIVHYQTDSLQYAQHFSIQHTENHSLLILYNPWQKGEILGKYYLTRHDSIPTPTDGIQLTIPLQTVCLQSAPHIGFIDALSQTECVVGTTSPELFYSPKLQQQYRTGHTHHLGDAYQMHLEKIVQLSPNALFITAYPQTDGQTNRLYQLHLPIIPTVEWTEPHLLGRAEWIKVYGLLFDQKELADSLFNATTQQYNRLTELAKKATHQPTIMSGLPFKDTWYMPGGKSFMGQLFEHANLSYHYSDNEQFGSLPLSFETVWFYFQQAEIWVGIDADSYQQLAQMDARLVQFAAAKNRQMYHYRKRLTPTGGNDFWESAVVYPDRLLHDLMCIAHPTILPNQDTYYIERLP